MKTVAVGNGTASYCTHTQNSSLVLIEHGESEQAAHAAHIGKCGNPTGHLIGSQAMRASASHQIGLTSGQCEDILLIGSAYHRHNQPIFQRNRYTHMDIISWLS